MDYIDHIFYINLDKRDDRRKEIEGELENMGWSGERFSGIYHPPPKGILGCTKSHLNVLLLAMQRNYENVLILEDDLLFLKGKEEVNNMIRELFAKKPTFDVCFLAYNLKKGEIDKEHPFLTRAYDSSTASAYIVNRHYYEKLILLYADAIPKLDKTMHHWKYANDQVWKPLQEKDRWYCFTDRIARQRDGYSDNSSTLLLFTRTKTNTKTMGDNAKPSNTTPAKKETKLDEKTRPEVVPPTDIVEGGIDLNKSDQNGMTALAFACLGGHLPIVELLLGMKIDINKADNNGTTPLMVACQNGNIDIVRLLVKSGGTSTPSNPFLSHTSFESTGATIGQDNMSVNKKDTLPNQKILIRR